MIAAAVLASMTGGVHAAETPATSPYPPQPKPAIQLAGFKVMAGSWACSGAMAGGAVGGGAAAVNYRSGILIEPLYGGLSYRVRYEQRFPARHSMVFSGTWYVGWDAARHEVFSFWLDDMGTVGREHGSGWVAGKLVLMGQGVAVMPASAHGSEVSRTVSLRDTFTRLSDNKLNWKGEMKLEGEPHWKVLGEDSCIKQ